ncbi:MAG: lysophospholipid acyltransferase family protein [Bryobacteraceae bacterium]
MDRIRAYLLIDPLILVATIVMGTLSMLVSLFDRSGNAAHGVARLWSRILILVSGMRVQVEGLENVPSGGGCVIASNHLSLMDTPLVLAHLPLQFRFLAKRGLFRVPFIGGHLRRAGHISIPREDARGSLKAMSEAARIIRERGVSALVFPEGGRSEGQLQPFKEGAAYIAIKAGVPIVPVGISGTRKVLPMGSLLARPGKVALRVGQPIPTTGMGLQDRTRLTAQIRSAVLELVK